jgi:glycosyltransferase involved in cell wall biosynthesis
LGIHAEQHDYLGTFTAGARDLLSHPLRAAVAEARLRSSTGLERVFIERETSPLSTGSIEGRILRSAGLGVYDLDDGFPWDTSGTIRRLFPKARKAERAARAADRVVVANAVLADWASNLNDDVRIIPSCVEPDDYVAKRDYALGDRPTIGWIGSQWTLPYLRTIEPALLQLHAETGARLELIGPLGGSLGPLDTMADRLEWSERIAHTRPAQWDLAIAPLRHGAFERARSSYKLLEYAAAGVPSIASRWGATGEIVSSLGVLGADSNDEWLAQFHALLGLSPAERAALGIAQSAAADHGYSYNAWSDQWRSVISE